MIQSYLIQNKKIFILILLVSIVRLTLFNFSLKNQETFLSNDTYSYNSTALVWLQTGSFSLSLDYLDIPETLRTPGYPFFLAIIYKIFGVGYSSVVLIQLFLSLLSIYLIYIVGTIIYNKKIGLFAALTFSFDPVSMSMNYKVLSETLFLFFLILFIFLGILWLKNPMSKSIPLISGVLLAIITLIRPITYFLSPFIIIGIIIWYTTNNYLVRKWINQFILFIIPILIIVGGWQYRNFKYGNNSSLSQIGGLNMLYHRGASVLAESKSTTIENARAQLFGDIKDDPWSYAGRYPEKNLNKKWQDKGVTIMTHHPFLTIKMICKGVFFTLFGPGDGYLSDILGYKIKGGNGPLGDFFDLDLKSYIKKWAVNNFFYFLIFIFACTFLLVLYSGVLAWIYKQSTSTELSWYDGFLWGILLYFIFISAGPEAYFRFRQPMIPILSIYSTLGWESIVAHYNSLKD